MSLCSTRQTSQVLVASHSFGPFFTLTLCCQGLTLMLGSGTCTGSPHWPNGCRRGWSRGEHEAAERPCNLLGSCAGRDLRVSCDPQPQPGAVVIHFPVTSGVPSTRPGTQVCVKSVSLPPCCLYTHPARSFLPLDSGNLRGLFCCMQTYFIPSCGRKRSSQELKTSLLVAGIALYLELSRWIGLIWSSTWFPLKWNLVQGRLLDAHNKL